MKRCISIVEDNHDIRTELEATVRRARDFELLSVYSNAEDALPRLPAEKPEILLLDINLPGLSGIELLERTRPYLPDSLVIMLTIREDAPSIVMALKAGANGYLLKQKSSGRMIEDVRRAIIGETPLSGAVARLVIQSFHTSFAAFPQCALSIREHQVLNELAKGKSQDEIASALCISRHTVSSHLQNCYRKLSATDKLDALRKSGKIK